MIRTPLLLALVMVAVMRTAWAFDPFVVKDIQVEGIQRIEAGTVFSYLPIKVGETFNEEKAQRTIKALFDTGFFRDVRLEVQNGVLLVIVQERPAIAQIDFVGLSEFKDEDVRKALRANGISEGRTFDKAVLDTAEREIKRQYLSRGRYAVNVTTTVTPLERNRVGINFTIDEGEVAKIRSISIVGNKAFTEKQLLDEITLTTPGWITWYTKNDQYSRQKLSADLEALRSFYLDRGYLDFNIESTQVSITPEKKDIYITVNVSEGERYTVRDVKLGGELLLPEPELAKLVVIKPGEVFSRQKLADSTKAITERLGNEGYAFANANAVPDIDREKQTVAFTIMIDPGRRVYVRRINVVGNNKTRDEVIRRELRQLEGAFYDGQKLQQSRRRVDRLGYFSEVELQTDPVPGTTDQVDVTLRVKERPTGNLLFGVGFSSADNLILSASVNQQNIFGSGKAVSLSINSGSVNRTYAFSYTNPYFTVNGLSQGFDIYARRFDATQLSLGKYVTDTKGAGLRFGYPVTDIDRVNFGVTLENIDIEVFPDSPPRFIDYVNTFGNSNSSLQLSAGWARDSRDSVIWPTSGALYRFGGEWAVPGLDLEYYKVNAQAMWYYSFTKDFTLMLNGELGYGDGLGEQPLPFFKAYYAGGVGTVRGFEQSSLGPRDQNGVLGGTRKAVGNAELLFPMPGLKQDRSVRLGVFFDIGQVWNPDIPGQDIGDLDFRYSTGIALGWNSPFGPLRLFYAFPLNKQDGDRTQPLQFTFGQQF